MKTFKYISTILLVAIISSCSSWLDVEPQDRVMEDKIFSDREGFLKALNGVYIELVDPSLYGSDLSYGTLDVLAQYYNVKNNSNSSYWIYGNYNYADANAKKKIDAIWSTAYNMIANCNTIIEKCDEKEEMLGQTFYPLIKGEALALRGMLHFDMLRLFGPVYREETKKQKCMPYITTSVQKVYPLSTAEEVLTSVIRDLKDAEKLLTIDPVITEGPRNYSNETGKNDLYYRQYRLNYFAVRALLARAYLWGGHQNEAFTYAKLNIDECQEEVTVESDKKLLFPFVTRESALDYNCPDRVFSGEVLFALYNLSRANIYDEHFSPSLRSHAIFTVAGDKRWKELYDDENDYRYKHWDSKVVETNVIYFRKFEEVSNFDGESMAFRYMMPLIRMSEMYLIAAETTDDADYALACINKLRRHRGCVTITLLPGELEDYITKEYRREMIGEGQMFFYYKRKGMQNIPDGGATETSSMNMELQNYTFPLPESETSQRTDY